MMMMTMYRLHDDDDDDVEDDDDDDGDMQVADDVPGRLPSLNSRVHVGSSRETLNQVMVMMIIVNQVS